MFRNQKRSTMKQIKILDWQAYTIEQEISDLDLKKREKKGTHQQPQEYTANQREISLFYLHFNKQKIEEPIHSPKKIRYKKGKIRKKERTVARYPNQKPAIFV
ncbi:hypothetical protein CIPAW_16G056100 [Carya illinoinensis]|uniref:Uncharacterized protein n=1 Tax=Carya illinoinensis TaxID=32201 RepID=A0A8T1N749_CARIL|nr:hypothetical protein CIPAW_16G056100 [Carya illinoinensis]